MRFPDIVPPQRRRLRHAQRAHVQQPDQRAQGKTSPPGPANRFPPSIGASGLPEGVTVSPSLGVAGSPAATGMGTALLTARDADGDVDTLSFSWTVASPNASNTGTVLSTTPNPTTGHDFNVAGAYSGPRAYYRLTLIETGPWGHSRVWNPAGIPFTQPVTNRVNGDYTYVLAGCYRDTAAILDTAYQVCERIGDALTVTVAGAETDPVAAQLADDYEVRAGHLDDDGLKDLYVRRTSSAAGGGLFVDAILQQAAGGDRACEGAALRVLADAGYEQEQVVSHLRHRAAGANGGGSVSA